MKTYRATLEETFDDDTSVQIHKENQSLDDILELFEILDGKSFPILQIFLTTSNYPHFTVIGGLNEYSISLRKDEKIWQSYINADDNTSEWKPFGLGYHNWELDTNQLCSKQVAIKAIIHFCTTGEWLTNLAYQSNENMSF